jgi:hypothetical protein
MFRSDGGSKRFHPSAELRRPLSPRLTPAPDVSPDENGVPNRCQFPPEDESEDRVAPLSFRCGVISRLFL